MEDNSNVPKCDIVFDSYLACAYVEGFNEGENATEVEVLYAWSYIIKNKLYNTLQGWYGRTAQRFIETGIFNDAGDINWDTVNQIFDGDRHKFED